MSLTLDRASTERICTLIERLLTPLDYADLSTWARLVVDDLCALHGADRGEMLVPLNGSLMTSAHGIPSQALTVCREFMGTMQPGLLRVKDPVVDRALLRRHAIGMRVWNHASFAALAGEALRDSPFYQEFVVPAGMAYSYGIRVPLPLGDAHLAIGYSHPDDDPYGVDDGEKLIGMLLPPFRAGVYAVRHFQQARSLLPHVIDELQLPIALFDADGRELHRSPKAPAA